MLLFLGSYIEAGKDCCQRPQYVPHSTSDYVSLFLYARHRLLLFQFKAALHK